MSVIYMGRGVARAIVSTIVIATGCSGVASTTGVRVTTPAIAAVQLSPATATVAVGDSTQLTATAVDSLGQPVSSASFSWSSSDGQVATVSPAGLVSGVAAGSATIRASSGGQSATAAVTVRSQPVAASECSHPQPGWIWCDDFEQDRLSKYFEYSNPGGTSFTRTAGVGYNGSYGMRVHWNAGQVNAGALHLAFGKTPASAFRAVDAGTANYRDLYWRVYLRLQPGWVGGGANKLTRALVFANSNWAEAAFAHVWSGGDSTNNTYLLLDPASGTDTAGNLLTTGYNDFAHMRWLGSAASTTPVFDAQHAGQWQCIEAHARLNTPGFSDGIFELWINGKLEARRTGLNWLGSFTAYGFNAVYLENYWNAGAPQAEDRYLDDLVVSTQPIGCSG